MTVCVHTYIYIYLSILCVCIGLFICCVMLFFMFIFMYLLHFLFTVLANLNEFSRPTSANLIRRCAEEMYGLPAVIFGSRLASRNLSGIPVSVPLWYCRSFGFR